MRRREFITLLGSVAAVWPLQSRAQQADTARRIAVLMLAVENDPQGQRRSAALERELDRLGWKSGLNLRIEYRWGVAEPQRAQTAVAELLGFNPDVIVADATAAFQAASQATHAVPIVFRGISEPVALGFIGSLSHPGGNVTGFANFEASICTKWLELLNRVAPKVKHVGFLFNPDANPVARLFYAAIEAAAANLDIRPTAVAVRERGDVETALAKLGSEPETGLIVPADQFLVLHRDLILAATARYGMPAIYPFDYFVRDGGLLSYGPDAVDQFREAASYVSRILRGEKPGDLPVQAPTKFELALNLRTAKALGLTIPSILLALADEVIE